jgi:exopolysaccharide production protein ExoQ
MPPRLALVIFSAAILGLLVRDMRRAPRVSLALWIPLLWMTLIGSRLPSEWLSGTEAATSQNAYLEGSPLDRNIFLFLIVSGLAVLLRRRINWRSLLTNNTAIILFLSYTFVSIAWSDFPLIALKRWHKVFGHVIMALVVLTDPDPDEAFKALFRRCGYVLIPLSLLFIKYYPEWGRGFDNWTGVAFNFGVTLNKNALGNLCVVMFLAFLTLMFSSSERRPSNRAVYAGCLFWIGWLLSIAHSASSFASTVIGSLVVVGMRNGPIRRHFTLLVIVFGVIVGSLQIFTNVKDAVIVNLGRDTTLTGRTELWEDLQKIEVNPIIGVGFESFWLGDRVAGLWRKYWWKPNQAHNGYYETYLNLGLVGLLLQLAMMVSAYVKARRQLLVDPRKEGIPHIPAAEMAPFRLAFLIAVAAFNLTDATFKALHLSFFVFFLVTCEYHVRQAVVAVPAMRRPSTRQAPRPAVLAPAGAARGRTMPPRHQPLAISGSGIKK